MYWKWEMCVFFHEKSHFTCEPFANSMRKDFFFGELHEKSFFFENSMRKDFGVEECV
jgi:hypothetical protein